MNILLDELKDVCKSFHLNELKYCILRLPETKDLVTNDVDILIKDADLKSFHNILLAQNFQYSNDSILTHQHFRRGKLHLDFVTSLCYGRDKEHFVSLGYDVLERAIFKNDMYIVSGIDEFATQLLHCLFDKRDFNKHSARIFQLIDIVGEEKCIKKVQRIFRSSI